MSDPYPRRRRGRGRRGPDGRQPAKSPDSYAGQPDRHLPGSYQPDDYRPGSYRPGSYRQGSYRQGRGLDAGPEAGYDRPLRRDPYGLPAEPLPGGYRPPSLARSEPDRSYPAGPPDRRGTPGKPGRGSPWEPDRLVAPRPEGRGTPAHGYRALPPPDGYETPARGYRTPMPGRRDSSAPPGRYTGSAPDTSDRPPAGRGDSAGPGSSRRPEPPDRYFPAVPRGQPNRPPQRESRLPPSRQDRYLQAPGKRQRPAAPGPQFPAPQAPPPDDSPLWQDLADPAGPAEYHIDPGEGTASDAGHEAFDDPLDDEAGLMARFAAGGPGHDIAYGPDPEDDDPDFTAFWADDDDIPASRGAARRVRRGGGRSGRGGQAKRLKGRKPRKARRGRRAAPVIAVLILLVLLAGGGAVGYKVLRTYVIPPDYSGPGTGTVVVQITAGQSAHDVAQTLTRLGVVASARAFIKAAQQDTQGVLDPGTYRLHRQMKASLALHLLLSPASRVQSKVTIPEGWRLSQIMTALGKRSGIGLSKYQAAAARPASLGLPSYAQGHLEGYLFPATYNVQPTMTATDVLHAMVQQFNRQVTQLGVTTRARQINLTPAQVITVASLIQAEAGQASDFPKIARVIYNRLNSGTQLDLDSTVMYALHTYGIMATDQQVQGTNSPYNTYRHTGLPPGPICSPGSAAIQAAMHPAAGNWIYFVTVDPAHHVTKFTASATEFQQMRAELQQNLAKKK